LVKGLYFQPNINHATIKSYSNEREAFKVALRDILPNSVMLQIMVDTYDMKNGLKTLIEEIKKLPKREQAKMKIPIDSGDLLETGRYIRQELNKNGLKHMGIVAYSNLDEYKIKKLEAQGSPIECYICITEIVNVSDAPVLEQVFKMSELRYPDGRIEHKAKLAKGKESYPGRKQIFRKYDKSGKMIRDIIGLEYEKLGEPLLKQYIKDGKRIITREDIKDTRVRLQKQLEKIPSVLKRTYAKNKFPVELSNNLKKLYNKVRKEHLR
jgi:nicotinate phosphoribosyltransferase